MESCFIIFGGGNKPIEPHTKKIEIAMFPAFSTLDSFFQHIYGKQHLVPLPPAPLELRIVGF